MKLRRFIEDNFLIDEARTGALIPFNFNPVQKKYYQILCEDYSEGKNFDNARELILKARKEGFTSFWLGIFTAIMFLTKNSMRFLEISYKEDATVQHFRRAKNYILSAFEKDPLKWCKDLEREVFESITDGSEFVLKQNHSSFYVGTASVRTGERGGNVQGVLFSESAHYPDTGLIQADEIIEGTKNMVPIGSGIVVQETTANGMNFFKDTWDMAEARKVDYKPRFFSWKEFYTEDEFEQIKKSFKDKRLIQQEYPATAEEAFLTSGSCFFDIDVLRVLLSRTTTPMQWGTLADVTTV